MAALEYLMTLWEAHPWYVRWPVAITLLLVMMFLFHVPLDPDIGP